MEVHWQGRRGRVLREMARAQDLPLQAADGLGIAFLDIAPRAFGAGERDGQSGLGSNRNDTRRIPKVFIKAQGAQVFMARIGMKSLSTLSTLGDWRLPEWDVIHVEVLPKVLTKPQDVQVFITHWGMKTMSILSTLGILGRVLDGQSPLPTTLESVANAGGLDAKHYLCAPGAGLGNPGIAGLCEHVTGVHLTHRKAVAQESGCIGQGGAFLDGLRPGQQ